MGNNRRPPPPKPPRRDDPNQLNFLDRLRFLVVNAEISKGALFGALTVSVAMLGMVVSTAQGVLSIWEASVASALLILCAMAALMVEARRSKGLEPEKAYRWHVGIGLMAILVPTAALIYSTTKAHTQARGNQGFATLASAHLALPIADFRNKIGQ